MKKFLAIMALALPMLATPVVTYTTTGTFTPGGTDTVAAGGGTLTYLSGGGSVDLGTINPSNATFGTFNTLGFSSVADLAGYSFTLTINQLTPSVDNGAFTGTLSGKIALNASNAYVNFASPTLVLGSVTYEIFQSAKGVAIVPPTTHPDGTIVGGNTTIQGQISAASTPESVTPEPGTIALMGLGLVAVGWWGRRYRAQ